MKTTLLGLYKERKFVYFKSLKLGNNYFNKFCLDRPKLEIVAKGSEGIMNAYGRPLRNANFKGYYNFAKNALLQTKSFFTTS
jgi:hypothetical protein